MSKVALLRLDIDYSLIQSIYMYHTSRYGVDYIYVFSSKACPACIALDKFNKAKRILKS
jgi:hypothetical protein